MKRYFIGIKEIENAAEFFGTQENKTLLNETRHLVIKYKYSTATVLTQADANRGVSLK